MLKKLHAERGVTLIELLIASVLGLFLVMGTYSIYFTNKKTFEFADGLARLQENARVIVERLNHDVRMAGYIGCSRLPDVFIKPLGTISLAEDTAIIGWHGGKAHTSFVLPPQIAKRTVRDSDILLVQEMDPDTADVTNINVAGDAISIAGKMDFKKGDVLMIASCQHVDFIRVEKISFRGGATTIYTSQDSPKLLAPDYQENSQIGYLLSLFYYVAKTTRKNKEGDAVFALYSQDANSPKPSELVDGVENMQLSFAVLNSGQQNLQDLTADNINNWAAVRSVSIALLMDSVEGIADRQLSYTFAGKTYQAKDHLLRKEVDTTIALREWLP